MRTLNVRIMLTFGITVIWISAWNPTLVDYLIGNACLPTFSHFPIEIGDELCPPNDIMDFSLHGFAAVVVGQQ